MTLAGAVGSTLPRPDLELSVSAEGTVTIIALRGEADLATLPVLADMLARVTADHTGAVVVDLAETEFIDTAAVRVLGRAWQILAARKRQLTVRAPSRLAVLVLAFCGFSDLVESGQGAEE